MFVVNVGFEFDDAPMKGRENEQGYNRGRGEEMDRAGPKYGSAGCPHGCLSRCNTFDGKLLLNLGGRVDG